MGHRALTSRGQLAAIAALIAFALSFLPPSATAAPAPGSLSITTTSLPAAVLGRAYSATLQASGGTPPYTWSVRSGSLPAGLTLNPSSGAITGDPTQGGSFSPQFQVSDASHPAQSDQRSFLVRVLTPTITISLGPSRITADGLAETTAVAKVIAGTASLSQERITFTSTDPGETIGQVRNDGGGIYLTTITASHSVGVATITATDLSAPGPPSAKATLTQGAPTIRVSLSRRKLRASRHSKAGLTITLTGVAGEPVPGQRIRVRLSGPARAGRVTDNGNGTYRVIIRAKRHHGKVRITVTDASVSPTVATTARLTVKRRRHHHHRRD